MLPRRVVDRQNSRFALYPQVNPLADEQPPASPLLAGIRMLIWYNAAVPGETPAYRTSKAARVSGPSVTVGGVTVAAGAAPLLEDRWRRRRSRELTRHLTSW